jgi:hypothetical protein
MHRSIPILACVIAGVVAASLPGESDLAAPARSDEGHVSIHGVFPPFDPSVHRYVSRCGRGAPPIGITASAPAKVGVGAGRLRAGEVRLRRPARPGHDFPITIEDGGGMTTYRVRCLPAGFPAWRFERFRDGPAGFFAVSITPPGRTPWVIVFDHAGVPRWWFSPPTRALWAQVLGDGSIAWARSFGDGYGLDPKMAHEIRSLAGRLERLVRTAGTIVDGHEYEELANGHVLVNAYVPGTGVDLSRFGGAANATAAFAEIQELDRLGRVVWRWNSRRRIHLGETGRWWRNVLSNPKLGSAGQQFDPVHINSIEPGLPGELVISTRHTDAVYGIDRRTGRIAWKLGGTPRPESLRVVGDPARRLFGGQHDVRLSRGGFLSIFDNGKDRPRRPRVAFYRLDRAAGTATYLGQLNDPGVRTSHCCGSARPLRGGGWLVSWGDNRVVSAFDRRGRLRFRYELAAPAFRAVPVPSGAATAREFDQGMEAMERHPSRRRSGSR